MADKSYKAYSARMRNMSGASWGENTRSKAHLGRVGFERNLKVDNYDRDSSNDSGDDLRRNQELISKTKDHQSIHARPSCNSSRAYSDYGDTNTTSHQPTTKLREPGTTEHCHSPRYVQKMKSLHSAKQSSRMSPYSRSPATSSFSSRFHSSSNLLESKPASLCSSVPFKQSQSPRPSTLNSPSSQSSFANQSSMKSSSSQYPSNRLPTSKLSSLQSPATNVSLKKSPSSMKLSSFDRRSMKSPSKKSHLLKSRSPKSPTNRHPSTMPPSSMKIFLSQFEQKPPSSLPSQRRSAKSNLIKSPPSYSQPKQHSLSLYSPSQSSLIKLGSLESAETQTQFRKPSPLKSPSSEAQAVPSQRPYETTRRNKERKDTTDKTEHECLSVIGIVPQSPSSKPRRNHKTLPSSKSHQKCPSNVSTDYNSRSPGGNQTRQKTVENPPEHRPSRFTTTNKSRDASQIARALLATNLELFEPDIQEDIAKEYVSLLHQTLKSDPQKKDTVVHESQLPIESDAKKVSPNVGTNDHPGRANLEIIQEGNDGMNRGSKHSKLCRSAYSVGRIADNTTLAQIGDANTTCHVHKIKHEKMLSRKHSKQIKNHKITHFFQCSSDTSNRLSFQNKPWEPEPTDEQVNKSSPDEDERKFARRTKIKISQDKLHDLQSNNIDGRDVLINNVLGEGTQPPLQKNEMSNHLKRELGSVKHAKVSHHVEDSKKQLKFKDVRPQMKGISSTKAILILLLFKTTRKLLTRKEVQMSFTMFKFKETNLHQRNLSKGAEQKCQMRMCWMTGERTI